MTSSKSRGTPVTNLKQRSSVAPDIPRPILKWAGGKSQLLSELEKSTPKEFNRFIEPFVGGGAMYFKLQPNDALISDSNAELVNLYKCVAQNSVAVHRNLIALPTDEKSYYEIRAMRVSELTPISAAARTIYLNRLGFNGLFRVNRKGEFNVPYGHPKRISFPTARQLAVSGALLKKSEIVAGDFRSILRESARPGNFIFLDPPYLPIGKYSDFKRYTAAQFCEEDHRDLALLVDELSENGCHILLTNSNHPLVHELYEKHQIRIVDTKRNINSNGQGRIGQDVIVVAHPKKSKKTRVAKSKIPQQMARFPTTRYMGSKNKILSPIHQVLSEQDFSTGIDLFSGSGVVSYLMKTMGKRVIANDHMKMASTFSRALIENNSCVITSSQLEMLIDTPKSPTNFVSTTFGGLYFSNDDNLMIDTIRQNIQRLRNPLARSVAMSSLIRACIKRRPRGIFTYVGDRYDDGRADLQKSIKEHFVAAIQLFNDAVFDNGFDNRSLNGDALSVRPLARSLVYIDPPYYSPRSDNEYVRRYHFVEGLACDWKGVEIQEHTKTKKFKSYPTPFTSHSGAVAAFDALFKRFQASTILVSYASNALPTADEMVELLGKYKTNVEVVPIDHRYSFGNQAHKIGDNRNKVKEYLFLGN